PLEIEVAPALHLAGPQQRLPSYLIASDPIEILVLYIGMFVIFNKKVRGILAVGIAPVDDRVFHLILIRHFAAMLKLIRVHIGSGVILHVLHVASPLQHQGFQPRFAQLLGSPSAADSRPDNDCIIGVLPFRVYVDIRHVIFRPVCSFLRYAGAYPSYLPGASSYTSSWVITYCELRYPWMVRRLTSPKNPDNGCPRSPLTASINAI